MTFRARFGVRSTGPSVALSAVSLILLTGCRTARPDPATEQAITLAAGIAEPVVFLVEAGPLDEAPAGVELSASDALRRAVTTDPGLQAALARVRIAMADADQARLLPNPILNVVLRWGPGKPQVELSLAQDLIQALQIPRRSGSADNRLRQSAADAVTVALDTIAEVQERYAAVQASDQIIPLLEGRLELLSKLADVARNRLSVGEGTRGDLTTLEAQRVELEVEIADARVRQREERLRLARLIGEPSSAATWTVDSWTAAMIASNPEERWVDIAMLHRPELQSLAWNLAALGDEYALARLLPWEGAGAGVDAQRDDQWFTGASVSTPIPVFDMGQARKARVTAEQIEARHNLTMVKRRIVEEVRVAYQMLSANEANLRRVRDELIPLQQQRLQQSEDAYRAGQTDVTPLFLAEQGLRATEARVIEIERQTTLALVRLQRAVGGPGVAIAPDSVAPTTSATPPPVHAHVPSMSSIVPPSHN